MDTHSDELTREFLDFSRRKLAGEFWPGIGTCLNSLNDDQVWWRPNESSNSIGNLLLHLNGNVRQWILAPLGGVEHSRDRDAEFAEREHLPLKALREKLDQTLTVLDGILSRLTPAELVKKHTIQGYKGVSGMAAIYHVVEHFGMHYGQILYITKLLTGKDLGFYRHLSGNKTAQPL